MSTDTARASRTTLLAQPAAVAGAAVAGAGLIGWLDPGRVPFLPPCPLHALTGLWCPFCGGTRAIDALVAGDLGAAAGLNLLVVVAIPLLAAQWVRWTVGRARGREAPFLRVSSRALAVIAAVAVAYMVLRNLPGMQVLTPPT